MEAEIHLMKTLLLAILMFTGIAVVAPDAEARHYRHDRYYGTRTYYHSGYRHYPRRYYYSRHYHRPYYYRSYYRPRYYYSDYCSPYRYYRRPGVSISFGF